MVVRSYVGQGRRIKAAWNEEALKRREELTVVLRQYGRLRIREDFSKKEIREMEKLYIKKENC